MKKVWLLLSVVGLFGCATLLDAPKNIVGCSTMDMEAARAQSVYQSYGCDLGQCFSSVIGVMEEKKINIFLKDEKRGLVVLMGIPGVVDTTEVGVFFTQLDQQKGVKVEVSSRSALAKRVVARIIFSELSNNFAKAQ